MKTRFIAFLDSYYITVDESINQLQIIFNGTGHSTISRPPKVNRMKNHHNMNQAIEAEKLYQVEYFERVNFYKNKLEGMI